MKKMMSGQGDQHVAGHHRVQLLAHVALDGAPDADAAVLFGGAVPQPHGGIFGVRHCGIVDSVESPVPSSRLRTSAATSITSAGARTVSPLR